MTVGSYLLFVLDGIFLAMWVWKTGTKSKIYFFLSLICMFVGNFLMPKGAMMSEIALIMTGIFFILCFVTKRMEIRMVWIGAMLLSLLVAVVFIIPA